MYLQVGKALLTTIESLPLLSQKVLQLQLADIIMLAGYSNMTMTLTPYRGVRYHLRKQAQANIRPQNYKELI
jgi:hypothetical protein